MSLKSGAFTPITCQELRRALHRTSEELGRVCKLTMDPRHSSIRLFRKAASELLCKHALASMWLEDARETEGTLQPYLKPLFLNIAVPREV
jgi:hypothetical protein